MNQYTSTDHAETIRRLFDELVEQAPEEQAERLATIGDTVLRQEVASLLDACDRSNAKIANLNELHALLVHPAAGANPHQLIGQRIRQYEIEAHLGSGGMGVVYKARDTKLDRHVALKFLPLHLATSGEARERFIQEAKAASALDHPHICTIHEIGETEEDQLFITMAYYKGQTLKEKISQGLLPIEDALNYAIQIAEGLARAHEAGIVHRDVKPANVMVTKGDTVKLVDFGLAKMSALNLTQVGMILGTMAYMSPEQVSGEAIDYRTDLWSLGVVLYEMLTGEHPFQGANQRVIFSAILNKDPEPLTQKMSEAPEALHHLVDRLLAKDRDARYQQATDLLADMEQLLPNRAARVGKPRWTGAPERLPDNLPAPLTSFIGRKHELEQAEALVARTRLLTLTGTGGTGKTRFGLRLSDMIKDSFRDGVCFVPMASLSAPDLVAPTIAQTLGVREMEGVPIKERLIAFLRDKNGLLVLDNFEQVVEAGPLVAELLAACSALKVLVTSRVPLHVQGEHEFIVPPLSLPVAGSSASPEQLVQFEAVALFVHRARAIKPTFALNAANASVVAEICTRLDGLPLAIELAAARIKVLSPRAILTRLQRRLGLLTRGTRDMPTRHQTLREAIAWSYDLLTKDEQKLFRLLAVFVGGHTLQAAKQACTAMDGLSVDVLDGLTSLVDKNLLWQEEQSDGEPRFFMLETIREFGLERLVANGEEAMVRRAHRDIFLALAEEAGPLLTGPQQVLWLDRLEQEHDNIRAALDWSLAHDHGSTAGPRIGAACWRFWLVRGYMNEGRKWLRQLLASEGVAAPSPERAKILAALGTMAQNQGDYAAARTHFEDGLVLYRAVADQQGVAASLNDLGWVSWRLSDYETARTLSEEGLALHRDLGNEGGIAISLNNLGWITEYQGDYTAARSYFQESLALRRALGDDRGIAFALTNVGRMTHHQGDLNQAATLLNEALVLFDEVGDKQLFACALNILADVVHDQGDHKRAATIIETESLPLVRALGSKYGTACALRTLADIVRDEEDYERAASLHQQSMEFWKQTGDQWGIAQSLSRLGHIARRLGEHEQAAAQCRESLMLRRDLGDKNGITECLEEMAYLAWDGQRMGRAVRLFGAAAALRTAIDGRPPRERAAYAETTASLRAHLGETAFAEAWDDGYGLSPHQAATYALNDDDTP